MKTLLTGRLAFLSMSLALIACALPAPTMSATDSLAKLRSDFTALQSQVGNDETAEANRNSSQSSRDTTQEARIKALEDAVVALKAAPAAATSSSTTSSVSYPKGVALANLQEVFDARPGMIGPLTKAVSSQPGYVVLSPTTQSDTDATGHEVYVNGGLFTFKNWKFAQTSGLYTIGVGHENGGGAVAQLVLSDSLIDQANASPYYGSVFVGRGSTLSVTRVSFLHASSTNLNIDGNTDLTDVYFDAPGQNPAPDGHTEGPHYYSGIHTATRVFMDARGWAGHMSHATGLMYVEAANDNVDVTVRDSIMAGAAGIGSLSPLQVFAKDGLHATLRMENVVLQAGNTTATGAPRYVYWGPRVTVICHNCRDYDTGEIIDGLLNFSTP